MRKYAEKPKNDLNGQVDLYNRYKLTDIYKLGWNCAESNKPDNWGIVQIYFRRNCGMKRGIWVDNARKYIKWAES